MSHRISKDVQLNVDNISISLEVLIKTVSDFPATIDSSKVYVLDGLIDMGSTEIIVPAGGIFLRGIDYFKSGMYSTADNYTMFKTDTGVPTSNVRMYELNFWASGTNSKLFDLDGTGGFGAIEFNSCNIGDFGGDTTEIGELIAFRQFRTNDCGFFRIQDGLTFTGAWRGGFRISDTIVLSQAANSTLFKVGTGLTFAGRCISDINAASVDPTTITFDFVASNFLLDGGFQLIGASFAPDSSISVTTDETEIQAFFRDCVEIKNTRPGIEMEFTTQATSTLTLNTPTKALGTTTSQNGTWWSQTGNNELTYLSSLSKDFRITTNVVVDGGANDEIALIIRQWDNSASAYVDLKSKVRNINNVVGGLDVATYSFVTWAEFAQNDRIEVWIENQSDSTDAILLTGSEIFVDAI